jgi:hypothetical protein
MKTSFLESKTCPSITCAHITLHIPFKHWVKFKPKFHGQILHLCIVFLLWIEPTIHLNVPRIILMMMIIKIGLGGVDLGSTNCH